VQLTIPSNSTAITTPKRERILALDLLRGFFMMAVIVDHIPWAPSLFYLLSGGAMLFASPAEGFFVISGMLVGYLYGPKILYQTRQVAKKIWKRAGLLYLLSVGFTLLFTVWAVLLPDERVPISLWNKDILGYFLNTFLLRYSYGWTDFLARYAVFMAIAPFILWFIAKGKWWIIALSSFLVWLILGRVELLLPFAAWQLLFIFGMIIGYYLPTLRKVWNIRITSKQRRTISRNLVITSLTSFILSVFFLVVLPYINTYIQNGVLDGIVQTVHSYSIYFDKATLGIGRIVLGSIWFGCLYFVVRTYETPINSFTKGVVELFGKNSLFIYGLHGFILFTLATIVHPIKSNNILVNTLIATLILTVIYFVAKYRHRIFARLHKVK